MFLANSLKEKLRRNYLESDNLETIERTKYPYKPRKKDPRVLLSFRQKGDGENQDSLIPQTFFSTQKLQSLDRKEWESTFTLDKLHSEWKTRVNLDFENNYKKFSDDFVLPGVKQTKEKIKESVNPDRLELKKKKWNISVNIKDDVKPELSKKLFEIENGFKDFKVIPPKIQEVEEGVDSRDHLEIDGKIWDLSNQIDNKEIKEEGKKKIFNAKENSIKYWRNNDDMRQSEKAFPISDDRKKLEVIRYFKKYRTPYQRNVDYYKTMQKIKEDTFIEREEAEKKVRYKNPGAEKYPEKINALILKEMYNTYRYKYNETVGKLSKGELLKIQKKNNRFKWFDNDLSKKIYAVNELTGEKFVEKSKEEENSTSLINNNYNTKNYESKINNKSIGGDSFSIKYKNARNLKESYSQEDQRRGRNKLYLAQLVPKGTDINSEEENLKELKEREIKRNQKKLSFMNKTYKNTLDEKYESKYPLGKKKYDYIKKKEKEESQKADYKINDYDKIHVKVPSNLLEIMNDPKKNSSKSQILNTYLDIISKKSKVSPFFLPAYNKIAEKEIKRINSQEQKNRLTKTFHYMHPGTYREFVFTENEIVNKEDNRPQTKTKKITVNLWSCCLNSDKNSKGCQRTTTRNFRWIYDP